MKKLFAFSLLFILLLCFLSFASAQVPEKLRINMDLARELMRVGQPAEAVKIITQLIDVYGETRELRELLKDALLSLKEYDKVEGMIKEDLSRAPNDWQLYTQLANVYLKTQRMDEAKQNLNRAIELVPDQKFTYQEVANVYLRNALRSEAMDTYKLARMKMGVANVFALELAGLYEQLFDYKQAVDEYFLFMGTDSTKFDLVEDRINRMIETDQHLDQIELALSQRISKNPRERYSHKLIGDLLFRRHDLDGAFESYKTVDELSKAQGRFILTFIQSCLNEGFYDQAIKSSRYLLSVQSPEDVTAAAELYIARSYQGQEKFDDAIRAYQGIIDKYQAPFTDEIAYAYFQIGEISLFQFRKPEDAFPRYEYVVQRLQDSPLYPDALVRLGDCMIAKGDLDSAQTLLTGASRDPKAEPKMEEIRYKLTEIDFFEGNFEAALEGYDRVIADFPKGFYVNNSLERTILIGEHQDLDRPLLVPFAEALLEKAQGKTESAISKLDGLISAKAEKLSDLAQMEKAKIYKEEKKYSESLKALNKLLEEYPQSFLCPQAQMMVGDLYNYHLNDRNKAIEAYQKLLKEYDRSVYVDEVRDRLRELKAEVSPSSSG